MHLPELNCMFMHIEVALISVRWMIFADVAVVLFCCCPDGGSSDHT